MVSGQVRSHESNMQPFVGIVCTASYCTADTTTDHRSAFSFLSSNISTTQNKNSKLVIPSPYIRVLQYSIYHHPSIHQ